MPLDGRSAALAKARRVEAFLSSGVGGVRPLKMRGEPVEDVAQFRFRARGDRLGCGPAGDSAEGDERGTGRERARVRGVVRVARRQSHARDSRGLRSSPRLGARGCHRARARGPLALQPVRSIGSRVVAYLRPKCTALLYDHSINSPLVARLNVYQSPCSPPSRRTVFAGGRQPRGKRGGGGGKGDGGGDSGGNKRRDSRKPSPAVLHEAIVAGVRCIGAGAASHGGCARHARRGGRIQRTHIRYLGPAPSRRFCGGNRRVDRGTLALIAEDLRAPTMHAAARRLAPVVEESLLEVFDEIRVRASSPIYRI